MPALLEFLTWWGRQLASFVPAKIRTKIRQFRPRLTLRIAEDFKRTPVVSATLYHHGVARKLGDFELADPGMILLGEAAQQFAKRADVTLELDDGSLLNRELSLPDAVRHSLKAALNYEFDHETPFRPDEVYWAATPLVGDRQDDLLTVRLVMILKRRLDPFLEALRRANLAPSRVVQDEVSLKLPQITGSRGSGRLPAMIAGSLLICLFVAGVAAPFIGQSLAMNRNASRIAQLTPAGQEVQAIRKQLGEDMREQQTSMGDPLIMLAALTDILPDNTRLIGLSIHNRLLELVGQSSASSLLIGRLAKSPDFENPIFSAPVTRQESAAEDTFSIKVQYTR